MNTCLSHEGKNFVPNKTFKVLPLHKLVGTLRLKESRSDVMAYVQNGKRVQQ